MFGFQKCKDYRIKGSTFPSDTDFGAYKTIDYRKEELPGDKDWKGNFLPYIPSILPFAMPPLPPALEALIDHAWRDTRVSAAARSAGRGPA